MRTEYRILCLLAAVASLAAAAYADNAPSWDPITGSPMVTTTNRVLVVPYRVTLHGTQLARVDLLVSSDLGSQWQLAASSTQPTGRLTYFARRPGIYWFLTRATDSLGQRENKPYAGIRPELVYRVVAPTPEAAPAVTPTAQTETPPDDETPAAGGQTTPPPEPPASAPTGGPVEGPAEGAPTEPPTEAEAPVAPEPQTRPAETEAQAEEPAAETSPPVAPLPPAAEPQAAEEPEPATRPASQTPEPEAPATRPAEPAAQGPANEPGDDPYASDPNDPAAAPPKIHLVRQRACQISYDVPGADAVGLASVELYYTSDHAMTWTKYDKNVALVSPATFVAPTEGLYGFYLVIRRLDGTGNQPPRTGTAPQNWALVDFTPPLLQILSPAESQVIRPKQAVRITWAAFDDRLVERPISIRYRRVDEAAWTPIAAAVPNSGEYTWQPPESLAGEIVLNVAAMDQTSNHTVREVRLRLEGDGLPHVAEAEPTPAPPTPAPPAAAEPPAFVPAAAPVPPHATPAMPVPAVPPPAPLPAPTPSPAPAAVPAPAPAAAPSPAPVPPPAAEPAAAGPQAAPDPVPLTAPPTAGGGEADDLLRRAHAAYTRGTLLRASQKLAEAEAAFREAIGLDPACAAAYNDLACLLLPQGRSQEAIDAFSAALKLAPGDSNALYGLAMAQLQARRFDEAAATLGKLVAVKPTDAEGWLYLGDVMYYRQQMSDARSCWEKAKRFATSRRVSGAAAGRLQQFR